MANGMLKEQAKADFGLLMGRVKEMAGELASAEELMRPVVMAYAISAYREALTPACVAAIRQLSGTSMGFQVDRDDYPDEVIRTAVIEAFLNDVSIVGNQFNVISGRFYLAKNGWTVKLKKAGCTQIVPNVGAPEDVAAGQPNAKGFRKFTALFKATATCMRDGHRQETKAGFDRDMDTRIEATAYGRDLSEALSQLKGKAEARILRKLWFHVNDAVETDDDDGGSVDVTSIPVQQVDDGIIDAEIATPAADVSDTVSETEPAAAAGDGDSHLAKRDLLVRRLDRILEARGECGVVVAARLIWRAPTVAAVAKVISGHGGGLEAHDADLLSQVGNWRAEDLKRANHAN
jgi:hypothetical protein